LDDAVDTKSIEGLGAGIRECLYDGDGTGADIKVGSSRSDHGEAKVFGVGLVGACRSLGEENPSTCDAVFVGHGRVSARVEVGVAASFGCKVAENLVDTLMGSVSSRVGGGAQGAVASISGKNNGGVMSSRADVEFGSIRGGGVGAIGTKEGEEAEVVTRVVDEAV
jgi:hypothetical protein